MNSVTIYRSTNADDPLAPTPRRLFLENIAGASACCSDGPRLPLRDTPVNNGEYIQCIRPKGGNLKLTTANTAYFDTPKEPNDRNGSSVFRAPSICVNGRIGVNSYFAAQHGGLLLRR